MSRQLTRNARALRRNQTQSERQLWSRLRDRRLDGLKFRRQQSCGPFIADFLCEDAMLVVELDGSQHAEPENAVADAERTRFLNALGYEVMRIWNNDVADNLDGVLRDIHARARGRVERKE